MITGAARNTGYAAAQRFAKEGWDVCITSRSAESAQNAAATLRQDYPNVRIEGISMVQGKIESIRAAFGQVRQLFGRLDAFIANAANLAIDLDTIFKRDKGIFHDHSSCQVEESVKTRREEKRRGVVANDNPPELASCADFDAKRKIKRQPGNWVQVGA